MPKERAVDRKLKILEGNGTLNKHTNKVKSPLFHGNPFFDSRDIVQVKYEMLRAVEKDEEPVSEAAPIFGFSRVSFYKTRDEFKQDGFQGLIPKKRGPHRAHKVTQEVINFINEQLNRNPNISKKELVEILKTSLGIGVHKRTVERAIVSSKKKHYKDF